MNKHHVSAALLIQMAVVLGATSARSANQTLLPAAVCAPAQANSAVGFAGLGEAYGYSTTYGVSLLCGVGQDQSLDTNDDVRIYFDDENVASTQNFVCYGFETDADHSSLVYSGVRYGCSSAGGCTSSPGVYAGENYITFADLQNGGDYRASVGCVIPAWDAPSGNFSVVRSLYIEEQ